MAKFSFRRAGATRRPDPRRRARRRALLWLVGSAMGVLAVLGAFAALRLATVARDLEDAGDLLRSASDHVELGELAAARDELVQAQVLLTSSNDRLYHSAPLDLLSALPFARQNLDALRDTVGLALRMTDGGNRILTVTQALEGDDGTLEVPLVDGRIPLADVEAAQEAVRSLAAVLPGPGYEPGRTMLAGPVARAQDLVFGEAVERRSQLEAVSEGLDLLAALAGRSGSARYLIAVANTAEMRGAGGMILSYGVLETDGGTFTLGEFGGIDELFLDEGVDPVALGLPADYLDRWAGLEPTRLWRNTTLNPDLGFDAPVMMAMFTARTGLPVDGVIQIDPDGLAAILAGTGPVLVPDVGAFDASNVVDFTINRAYVDFPDRDQRQELLGDVAEAAFDALVAGEFGSLRPLGEALFAAAQERHLAVYLADDAAHDDAAFFGATAALPGPGQIDHAILTVQNFSKNKLDYYLDTSLDLVGTRPSGAPGAMTATITVANTAPPDGTADYVFGPNAEGEVAGLYRGLVSLYVPTGSTLVGFAGDAASEPVLTSEAGRTVIGFDVEIPAGETRTVELELAFAPRPAGPYEITLAPVPRVRPTVVSVAIDIGESTVRRPAAPLARLEVVAG